MSVVGRYYLLHPGSVRINRGNHEDVFMNLVSTESGGGFYQEVTMKYNAETYELFAAASS